MRHRNKNQHFSRPYALRKALKNSIIRAVLLNGRITTTDAKARAAASWVDKMVTLAKQDTLHARRLAFRLLQDHALVRHLFTTIAPRFKTRQGGYTRVLKLGVVRKGDGAPLSLIEFVDYRAKVKKVKEDSKQPREKAPHIKDAVIEPSAMHAPVEASSTKAAEKPKKAAKKEGLITKLFKKEKPEQNEKSEKAEKASKKQKKQKGS